MKSFSETLPRTHTAVLRGMEAGWHIGTQLFASLDGIPVADSALGESRPGVAMSPDTVMLWLSSTKPIAAVGTMQLFEAGKLQLDQRVSELVPEFAVGGKEAITVRHLLTHTGGFRRFEDPGPEATWAEIIEQVCKLPIEPGWISGQKAGYHIASSWYILGEIIRRIDGRPFSQYARQQIFEPLGMRDCWIGMPPEQYDAYGDRLGIMQNTEKPGQPPHRWSTKAGAAHCSPGGNGHGPIRELAYLYEAMLGGGMRGGVRILQPETVGMMTSRQREGMFDETFRHIMDWGLGLIINSNRYGPDTVPYGYGRHASEPAFGHSGSQSSVGFADPERRLAAGIVLNGMPGELRHRKRMREICEALYEDLGLA